MPKKVEWYRLNAERCQRLAETFKDPEAKRTLAAMADSWLMLAARRVKRVAERVNATPPHRGGDVAATWQNAHTWRMRAEETRAVASEMNEAEPKAVMLRIADDYDWLSEWAEKNALNLFGERRRTTV